LLSKEAGMSYPRVFIGGEEAQSPEDRARAIPAVADVLIVCGQGVYEDGTFFGEFHDRDVYFDHAIRFPDVAARLNCNTVILSGGFTQPSAPWLSEAESFLRILQDAAISPPEMLLILDECALDSAENLLLGLMTARLVLGKVPIRRVVIWAAWQFKKWRFNRNAESLGIVERTYVYGFAPSAAADILVPADDENKKTFDEYRRDSVEASLLRTADWEAKRRSRWQNNRFDPDRESSIATLYRGVAGSWLRALAQDGTPLARYEGRICSLYSNRMTAFDRFQAVRNSLRLMEAGSSAEEAGLREGWSREIMSPE
jgi:hypothetical protein